MISEYRRLVEEFSKLSWENDDEEMILFTLEEVEGVVGGLKLGKSGGLDHLQPEHLHFGDQSLLLWIQQVCNAVIESEVVSTTFKQGMLIPVYKGHGKDPLNTNSYRGITLTRSSPPPCSCSYWTPPTTSGEEPAGSMCGWVICRGLATLLTFSVMIHKFKEVHYAWGNLSLFTKG